MNPLLQLKEMKKGAPLSFKGRIKKVILIEMALAGKKKYWYALSSTNLRHNLWVSKLTKQPCVTISPPRKNYNKYEDDEKLPFATLSKLFFAQ